MCRWSAWIGNPIFLDTVISDPAHSLISQSKSAEECKTAINADGFGVAWYDAKPVPGLYRDTFPAWSDPNLRSLACQIHASVFLAHVRASTGTATSRNNCHPFVKGRWSFMHNGQIGGFEDFRKDADMLIPSDLYAHRLGATDSEVLFLLAIAGGLDATPYVAMQKAVAQLEALSRSHGSTPHMRLTAAFSNGNKLYAARYASDNRAPSLYYRQNDKGTALVSEPFDTDAGWKEVPQGSFCTFEKDHAVIEPFQARAFDDLTLAAQ